MDPYPYFLEDRHTTTWPSELLCYYHFNQKKEGDTEDKDAGIVEEEEEKEAAQEEEKMGFEARTCSRNCQVLLQYLFCAPS